MLVCAPLSIPLQLIIDPFGSLRQADGVEVEVAVEDDRSAGERSGQGAGEAAQEHVLTCGTTEHNASPRGRFNPAALGGGEEAWRRH